MPEYTYDYTLPFKLKGSQIRLLSHWYPVRQCIRFSRGMPRQGGRNPKPQKPTLWNSMREGGGGGFATLLGLISYLRGSLPSCRWSLCCHWGWMWWLCIQMITVLWYIQDLFNCIESQTWCSRIYHFELSGINSKVTAIMRSQIPRNFFSPPPVNCHFQNMFCPRF